MANPKKQNFMDDSELESDYAQEPIRSKGGKLNITQKIPHLKDFFNDN